jgi:hypothetical protein
MSLPLKHRIRVLRVARDLDRVEALKVLKATYREEKNWVADETRMFAPGDLTNRDVSWFVAFVGTQPVGVVRVLYSPPLELYHEYKLKPIDGELDVDTFVRTHRIAEIGRFAVVPEYRRDLLVAAALMRAASKETVERGYTHYITDIFEGERHSPYKFHTRVMGFQPVATHDTGELNCPCRRITMVLDLAAAYRRIRERQNWIFRYLTEDWSEAVHQALLERPSTESASGAAARPDA